MGAFGRLAPPLSPRAAYSALNTPDAQPAWGLRKDGGNPCRFVQRYKEKKRERFLTILRYWVVSQDVV